MSDNIWLSIMWAVAFAILTVIVFSIVNSAPISAEKISYCINMCKPNEGLVDMYIKGSCECKNKATFPPLPAK